MGKRNLEPEKVAQVLDMLKSAGRLTDNAISIAVGVSAQTVKKLRTKHDSDEEMNGPFFSQRLDKVSHTELMNICLQGRKARANTLIRQRRCFPAKRAASPAGGAAPAARPPA